MMALSAVSPSVGSVVSLLAVLFGATGCGPCGVPPVPPPLDADAGGEPAPSVSCLPRLAPPGLGVFDAQVDSEAAQRFLNYRDQVEFHRVLEQVEPEAVIGSLRIEQDQIQAGCLDLDELVDVGRALFRREFTWSEGYGGGDEPSRFQRGRRGGPDTLSCRSCHWKGGEAGAGDRVDNSYLFGDGDDVETADIRNPPALWGAGWRELLAHEMSTDLQAQRDALIDEVVSTGARTTRTLQTKGISFGELSAVRTSDASVEVDYTRVSGVDSDLVIKPFGWKGTFATLREFISTSFAVHLGLQAEELVASGGEEHVELGDGQARDDPDEDGVIRELTEGQMTAITLFVATLDTPLFLAPEEGAYRALELYAKELEFIRSPEFTARWREGYAEFSRIGCAVCHVPYLPLKNSRYRTTAPLSAHAVEVDLATEAAKPVPMSDEEGLFLVPVFSDFRRHHLGAGLASLYVDDNVAQEEWLTRPLWGVAQTSPYLHRGDAITFDDVVSMHGGEAEAAAANYRLLSEARRESLRFFLASLARAPTLRVR